MLGAEIVLINDGGLFVGHFWAVDQSAGCGMPRFAVQTDGKSLSWKLICCSYQLELVMHPAILNATLVLGIVTCHALADAAEPKSIKEAIANLVSENEAPVITDEFRVTRIRYPAGYDHAKQQKVIEAYTYLLGKGVEAFPELMAEDIPVDKFSCVRTGDSGGRHPLNVGKVIWIIVSRNIDAARYQLVVRGGAVVPRDLKELRPWLAARRNSTLKDLQLESIAKLRAQFTTGVFSEYNDKETLTRLQELETRLQKSGKDEPLVVKGGYRVDEFKEADRQQNIPAGSKVWILD